MASSYSYLSCNCISNGNWTMSSPLCLKSFLLICLHYLDSRSSIPQAYFLGTFREAFRALSWTRPRFRVIEAWWPELITAPHCRSVSWSLHLSSRGNSNVFSLHWSKCKRLFVAGGREPRTMTEGKEPRCCLVTPRSRRTGVASSLHRDILAIEWSPNHLNWCGR